VFLAKKWLKRPYFRVKEVFLEKGSKKHRVFLRKILG
jgi:hypothetical protein